MDYSKQMKPYYLILFIINVVNEKSGNEVVAGK